ncbi:MAG: DNA repair protein RecO [Acidimicrobiales bacterium]
MALYREDAIVLRTWKLGEADRIVNLLTRGHGKVRAVAKGVRKTSSRFGARLEPTSHVALQLYQGRELDTITQAESLATFRSIRGDFERFAKASTVLEAVDQIAQERHSAPRLHAMLLGVLRTLDGHDAPLVVPGFLLKLLALEGLRPVVDACAVCGTDDDLVAFDPIEGGVLCRAHRRGPAVSEEARRLLRLILGGQLGAALNEPASPATHEVAHLATEAMEHHLERRLRSATLLDRA